MFKVHVRGGFSFHLSALLKAWFGFDLQEWLHPLRTDDNGPATDTPVTYLPLPANPKAVVPTLPATSDDPLTDHVRYVITRIDTERQRVEDTRADRRNRNRMLTLFGALVIGAAVTWFLNSQYSSGMPPSAKQYAFTITIAMDSLLAAYSWVRHY
jgi:hypothetical protein